jgi:hypothetical protein
MQRGTPCRAGAEAGQLGEELNQGVEFGHCLRRAVPPAPPSRVVGRGVRG